MYERILVPLDGSKTGEAALPYVEELVTKLLPNTKVEVILLQVVSSLTYYVIAGEASPPVPYTEEEIAQLKRQAVDYLNKVGETLSSKGVTVTTKVMMGNAAEEIIREADETDATLIAMSTHGRSGLSRWAFGSVAGKVLRGVSSPIILVRTRLVESAPV